MAHPFHLAKSPECPLIDYIPDSISISSQTLSLFSLFAIIETLEVIKPHLTSADADSFFLSLWSLSQSSLTALVRP